MLTPCVLVGGIVLCGGRSRRMGRPKEWLPIGEEFQLQRVVRIVAGVVRPVVVAARPGQDLPPLPQEVVITHDQVADSGPLAGVAAGFKALAGRCEAAFVVSCDQPLLKTEFILRLTELLGDHPAIVPVHDGRPHPLTAIYRLSTGDTLEQLLAERELAVHRFAKQCGAYWVSEEHFKESDPWLESLHNVNEPTDSMVGEQGRANSSKGSTGPGP